MSERLKYGLQASCLLAFTLLVCALIWLAIPRPYEPTAPTISSPTAPLMREERRRP